MIIKEKTGHFSEKTKKFVYALEEMLTENNLEYGLFVELMDF